MDIGVLIPIQNIVMDKEACFWSDKKNIYCWIFRKINVLKFEERNLKTILRECIPRWGYKYIMSYFIVLAFWTHIGNTNSQWITGLISIVLSKSSCVLFLHWCVYLLWRNFYFSTLQSSCKCDFILNIDVTLNKLVT